MISLSSAFLSQRPPRKRETSSVFVEKSIASVHQNVLAPVRISFLSGSSLVWNPVSNLLGNKPNGGTNSK